MSNTNKEHQRRRKRLLQAIGHGNVGIIAGAPATVRNNDVEHPYRQDSDFYYLTGFAEPDSVAVFIPGRKQGEYILFCREYDQKTALWTGKNAGLHGARTLYGADDAFPIDDLDDILPGLLENRERVYYSMGRQPELDQRLMEWIAVLRQKARGGVHAPVEFVSLEHVLHEMRLYKSATEIRLMRHAADVSARAHIRAMQSCRPGRHEYEIEAEIIHEFMRNGLRSPAYPSIVAGGDNACILHYTANTDALKAGDLLLIDAGAEHDYYAADITRTFPVSGRFTDPQRAIYQLVLDAQQAAIRSVRPGNRWNEPHDTAVRVLTGGLVRLGILRGDVDTLIERQDYKPFFMHRTGHWLGMDVHDVGEYKRGDQWRRLEPGMVLTVEPGLYIPRSRRHVARQWRGIGVRIEDDVLVTKTGCEILSSGVPSTIDEIEQLMRDG